MKEKVNNFLSNLFLDIKRNYIKKKFPKFQRFKSIPRLSRECIITEKIDGSNGIIYIDKNNNIFAGSRNRWLWGSIQDKIYNDNHGFAQWVKQNKEELLKLGKGIHYGEWYGYKINRNYKLNHNRFALFNREKWNPNNIPECCEVVPILYKGIFDIDSIQKTLKQLEKNGSLAVPGFMNPEGIVIYHKTSGQLFKKTIKNDEKGKRQ